MRDRPLARFGSLLMLVLLLDLGTKLAAERLLADREVPLFGPVGLRLVHNDEIPFGSTEQQLNTLLILLLIGLGLRALGALSSVDRSAPAMLGLITGAGLANAAGLLTSPAGVVDFIAVRYGDDSVVLNLADLATFAGLLLCGRLAFRLARTLAARERPRPPAALGPRPGRATGEVPPWVLEELEGARTDDPGVRPTG